MNYQYFATEFGPTDLSGGTVDDCELACNRLVRQLIGYLGQETTDCDSYTKADLAEFLNAFYELQFETTAEKLPYRRTVAGITLAVVATSDSLCDPLYDD